MDITVSSSSCGGTYDLGTGSVTLKYKGSSLYRTDCRFTLKTSDYSKKICSSPKKFKINSCGTTIEYHDAYYSSYSNDGVSLTIFSSPQQSLGGCI